MVLIIVEAPLYSRALAEPLSDGAQQIVSSNEQAAHNDVTHFDARWMPGRRCARTATMLSLAATGFLGAGIWLGEHLVYGLGVGVDTTAFEHLPEDWTDVAAETDVPADGAVRVDAGRVPVLLSRLPDGIVALADRCTHRGGPLHEGTVAEGCVTCPWHGSTFDLFTGYVVDGPSSRPEPRLEVQTLDGRVRVRRAGAGN